MKRMLATLLAILVLVLISLTGCSKAVPDPNTQTDSPSSQTGQTATVPLQNPPSGSEEEVELTQTPPNQFVPEKLAAGMEVLVAAVWQGLTDQLFVLIDENLALIAQEQGYTLSLIHI